MLPIPALLSKLVGRELGDEELLREPHACIGSLAGTSLW